MRKIPALALAVVLVMGACSSGPENDDLPGESRSGGKDGAAADARTSPGPSTTSLSPLEETASPKPRSENGKKDLAAPAEQGREREGGGGSSSPGNSTSSGGSDPGSAPGDDAGREPEPQSGRYVYAQQGWEEFCSGTCQRGALPPTQPIDAQVMRTHGGITLVTDARSSRNRSIRTTAYLSRGALDITRVELRYRGFSNTYQPSPPVRSLRLPLSVGASWSGSWEAETSGDYSMTVVDRERLEVDGRMVKTFKLDTVTTFRGEFRGRMVATVWVDPGSAMTIRSHGKVNVSTSIGSFASKFDTMLLRGPGY
jgi:hypothetical protein